MALRAGLFSTLLFHLERNVADKGASQCCYRDRTRVRTSRHRSRKLPVRDDRENRRWRLDLTPSEHLPCLHVASPALSARSIPRRREGAYQRILPTLSVGCGFLADGGASTLTLSTADPMMAPYSA